jgi:hypothetical protein
LQTIDCVAAFAAFDATRYISCCAISSSWIISLAAISRLHGLHVSQVLIQHVAIYGEPYKIMGLRDPGLVGAGEHTYDAKISVKKQLYQVVEGRASWANALALAYTWHALGIYND